MNLEKLETLTCSECGELFEALIPSGSRYSVAKCTHCNTKLKTYLEDNEDDYSVWVVGPVEDSVNARV